jgi:hypothetical protein
LLNPQHVTRQLLDTLRNGPTVLPAERKRSQNQEI